MEANDSRPQKTHVRPRPNFGVIVIITLLGIGVVGLMINRNKAPRSPSVNLLDIRKNGYRPSIKDDKSFIHVPGSSIKNRSIKPKTNSRTQKSSSGFERCLSGPKRVHYGLIREVKAYLPNPTSFKHVRTRTVPRGRYHALIMDFTHENPYRVSQTAVASLDEKNCDALFMFIE